MPKTYTPFKKAITVSIMLLVAQAMCFGQSQIIGSFPAAEGGFDGTSAGSLGTTLSSSAWTRQNVASSSGTITATGGRSSGPYATVNSNTASSARVLQSPQQVGTTASTAYRIQFYYKSSSNATNFQSGVSFNGTTNPTYTTAATLNSTGGVWTKYESTVTLSSGTVSSNGIAIVRFSASGGNVNVDIDDLVIYAGASVDNAAPNSPGTVTVNNATTSSLDVSWGAASGGVDGGGYVVVRYETNPNADNDPNANGIYAVGNTTTNGTGSLTGTIRYIGTSTSFTDNVSLSQSTTYYYKVYTVDKAFNYSAESSGNGTTTSSCTAPSTQPSSFASNTIASTTANIAFTRGNGDGGVLVIARATTAVATAPTSNTSYMADAAFGSGTAIGSGFVVYNGTAAGISNATGNIALTGLTQNTTYHFAAYEYNSTGTCYNLTSPLTGSFTTTSSSATISVVGTVGNLGTIITGNSIWN
jgi:trimeric autotransporter adhesin